MRKCHLVKRSITSTSSSCVKFDSLKLAAKNAEFLFPKLSKPTTKLNMSKINKFPKKSPKIAIYLSKQSGCTDSNKTL